MRNVHKPWIPSPTPSKGGTVVQACNPSIWALEAEGSEVQGHLQIQSEFEANLDYLIP